MTASNFDFLDEQIIELRKKYLNKKIIFISGNFNLIHPGHVRFINFARSCGEVLIVGLLDDTSQNSLISSTIRYESLKSLISVSEVLHINDSNLLYTIEKLKPNFVVKGKEHENRFNSEFEIISQYGGQLIFSAGESINSGFDIYKNLLITHDKKLFNSDKIYLNNHNIKINNLISIIKDFSKLKIAVFGDVILDDYINCESLGMSQEDPTIVVRPINNNIYLGGAGIVAAHLASLGSVVTFFSVLGDDVNADYTKNKLDNYNVKSYLIKDSTRPTIVKQRYRSNNKTLLRVNNLRSHDSADIYTDKLLKYFEENIKSFDMVIFSDFNYGCLPDFFISKIINLCKSHDIKYTADSQSSSQVGDISKYIGADLICATEREIRIAMNDFKSGIQNIANKLIHKSLVKNLILKLGSEGIISVHNKNSEVITSSLQAFNPNPVDVAGAGDAMLATASLAIATGATFWEASYLSNLSAAFQISRIGNLPIDKNDIIYSLLNS